MSKDNRGSTCTDVFGSVFTDFSTEITGVRGSTCPYILTKYTGVHGVTPTDDSMVKTVVIGRTNAYEKYGR